MESQWRLMYLGAFGALLIPDVEMAADLAALTRSDAEASTAIQIMRRAEPGDRVYPALTWLREERRDQCERMREDEMYFRRQDTED